MTTRRRSSRSDDTGPRIDDVARAANVSTATVSRVLSAPDSVKEEKRTRVLEAIAALGYTPNAAARNLRVGSSKMVLVIVSHRANPPFSAEVLRGIETELSSAGYAVIMGNLHGDEDRRRRVVDLAYSRHLDGIIVISGNPQAAGGRSIVDAGIPVVSICVALDDPRVFSVLLDDASCAATQLRYLTDLGHERIMYVTGPLDNYNQIHRSKGFNDAAAQAGLTADDIVMHEGDYGFSGGVSAAENYFARSTRPTGIVCSNDEMAIGFIKTVRAAGVRVPEDVSVVGFDGIEFSEFCEPSLTTIQQPRYELGATGARALISAIGGSEAVGRSPEILHGCLIVRDSTGKPPSAFRRKRTINP
jgi:LacI family repressor for deo operon, udp, cdd, tsx, nupC, and nupG